MCVSFCLFGMMIGESDIWEKETIRTKIWMRRWWWWWWSFGSWSTLCLLRTDGVRLETILYLTSEDQHAKWDESIVITLIVKTKNENKVDNQISYFLFLLLLSLEILDHHQEKNTFVPSSGIKITIKLFFISLSKRVLISVFASFFLYPRLIINIRERERERVKKLNEWIVL